MTGFSISWLDLREKADFAARDKNIAKSAVDWLNQKSNHFSPGKIIVDLGSGTGSTLRALSELGIYNFGANNVVWRLVDYNGALLDEALKRHGKSCLIEDYQSDLTVINELPLGGAHLVTASALFDLASAEFVDALAIELAARNIGLYAALNYDGVTDWTPTHPYDQTVLDAFNKDQLRDKGMGPALGPHSGSYLQHAFEKSGYHVVVASSPWQLKSTDYKLVEELINGIANAVSVDYALDTTALEEWKTFRLAHANTGTCIIGHQDVFAIPKSEVK